MDRIFNLLKEFLDETLEFAFLDRLARKFIRALLDCSIYVFAAYIGSSFFS